MTIPRILSAAFFLALAAVACSASTGSAQVCRGAQADSMHIYIVERAKEYALATDEYFMAARDSLRILPVAEKDIVLETKETVCKNAQTAYRNRVGGAGTGWTGRVFVVRMGPSRYLVWDPGYRYSPVHPTYTHMVLSSRYEVLSIF